MKKIKQEHKFKSNSIGSEVPAAYEYSTQRTGPSCRPRTSSLDELNTSLKDYSGMLLFSCTQISRQMNILREGKHRRIYKQPIMELVAFNNQISI